MTIYFLKDVLSCKKKHVKNSHVQTLWCPQYENLTLKCIGGYVGQHPDINKYLPDAADLPKVPKQWIIDVCAAVIGQPFREWVKDQVEERNAIMAEKKEMMISMDPEMAAKFQASTHVSRKYPTHQSVNLPFFPYSLEGRVCEHAEDL